MNSLSRGHFLTVSSYAVDFDAKTLRNNHKQIGTEIECASSKCSRFVRSIIMKSSSYEQARINDNIATPDSIEELTARINIHEELQVEIRTEGNRVAKSFHDAGADQDTSLVMAYVYNCITAMKSNTGVCTDMSLIACALAKHAIESHLKNNLFSKNDIRDLNINISVMTNNEFGGDHVIGLLTYVVDRKEVKFVIDPWSDGATFNFDNMNSFYMEHPGGEYCYYNSDNDCTTKFEVDDDYTKVVNNNIFSEEIINWLDRNYGVDFSSPNPFPNLWRDPMGSVALRG